MKTKIFSFITLITVAINLSPVNSFAHGFSVPTQWESNRLNVYKNESNFVKVPAQLGDVIGGISGGAIGIAVGLPVGVISTLLSGRGVDLLLAPYLGNTVVGSAGRIAGSAIVGTPFYLVEKPFQLISQEFVTNKHRLNKQCINP